MNSNERFLGLLDNIIDKPEEEDFPGPLKRKLNVPFSPLIQGRTDTKELSAPTDFVGTKPVTKELSPIRDFLNKSQLSDTMATLAKAISPDTFGGRLGEGVLAMNARTLKNLEGAQREEREQGTYDLNKQIAEVAQEEQNKKLRAREGILRNLREPRDSGKSLIEDQYPGDMPRQSIALDEMRLGDMKGIDEIMKRPGIQVKNLAIDSALKKVDESVSTDEQRKQFVQEFVKINPNASTEDVINLSKLVISGPEEGGNLKTIYGPEGLTKEVFIPRGSGYEPPKGWSLRSPKELGEVRVSPSKVKQDMNMIQNQISSVTGLLGMEQDDNADIQNLKLEAQEMLESGKSLKEAWIAIKGALPVKIEEPKELGLFEKFKRFLGFSEEPKKVQKSSNIPKVGEVRKGYKFKGGDPANKLNWEKM